MKSMKDYLEAGYVVYQSSWYGDAEVEMEWYDEEEEELFEFGREEEGKVVYFYQKDSEEDDE